MDNQVPLRTPPLSEQIVEFLIERIQSGVYPPDSQLPPENELAAEFGVSRATIRSAVGALASRGLVVRRQGVGTFVSQLSRIRNPLNQFISFLDLVASNGFEPGYMQVSAEEIEADSDLARRLRIEPGGKVLRVRKVFTADADPIIYCVNHIPAWVYQKCFSSADAVQPGITEPIFEFLEQSCDQRVKYYIASVRAEIMKDCDLQDSPLSCDELSPVLVIDEIGYNFDETPVHHSIEYHPGNRMRFELVRSHGPSPS